MNRKEVHLKTRRSPVFLTSKTILLTNERSIERLVSALLMEL